MSQSVTEIAPVELENVIESHTPIDPSVCKKYLGINASLTNAFKIGDEKFGIFMSSDRSRTTSKSNSYLLAQFGSGGRVIEDTIKTLNNGDSVTLGRSNPMGFELDSKVSRSHVDISIENNEPYVKDLGSTNGTTDAYYGVLKYLQAELKNDIIKNNIESAKKVHIYELTRSPNNEGEPVDPNYIRNQSEVRKLFVQSIIDGSLYRRDSGQNFLTKLRTAHMIANTGDLYEIIGKGVEKVRSGKIRGPDTLPKNNRKTSAEKVANLAKEYGDPYSERFITKGEYYLPLRGVAKEHLPYDEIDEENNYTYYYPKGEAINEYMNRINDLGVEILRRLYSGNYVHDDVIELIAKQYQYGAVIRPFYQINNSLFMNLANAQLKLFGYKGISHFDLDLDAQRMSPDTFTKYFKDTVKEFNKY